MEQSSPFVSHQLFQLNLLRSLIFHGYVLIAGGIGKGDILVGDIEEVGEHLERRLADVELRTLFSLAHSLPAYVVAV